MPEDDNAIVLNEIDNEWWKKWESSPLVERTKMVRKIVNQNLRYMLLENSNFKSDREERLFMMALTTLINSYFEDLYVYVVDKYTGAVTDVISAATEMAKEEGEKNEKKDDGVLENGHENLEQ